MPNKIIRKLLLVLLIIISLIIYSYGLDYLLHLGIKVGTLIRNSFVC